MATEPMRNAEIPRIEGLHIPRSAATTLELRERLTGRLHQPDTLSELKVFRSVEVGTLTTIALGVSKELSLTTQQTIELSPEVVARLKQEGIDPLQWITSAPFQVDRIRTSVGQNEQTADSTAEITVATTAAADTLIEQQLMHAQPESPEALLNFLPVIVLAATRIFGEHSPITQQVVKYVLILTTLVAAGMLLLACNQQPVSPETQPTDTPTSPPITVPETLPPTPKLVEGAQQEMSQPTQVQSPTATEGVPYGGPITPEFITNILNTVGVDATYVENIVAGETVEWKADVTVDGKTIPVSATLVDGSLHIFVEGIDKGTQSTSSGSAVVETATPAPGVYCTTDIRVRNGPGTAFDILKTCAAGTNFPADQIEGVVNTPDQNVKQWLVLAGEPKQYIAVIPGALDIVGIDLTKLAEQPAPEATGAATVAPSPETTTQIESGELTALKEQVASWLENGLADIDQDSQFYFFGEPLEVGGYGIRPDPLERSHVGGYGKFLGLINLNSYEIAYIGFVDSNGSPFVVASSLGRTDDSLQLVGLNLAETNEISIANNTTAVRLPTTDVATQLAHHSSQMAVIQYFYTQMALSDGRITPERRAEIAYLWDTNEEANVVQRLLYGDLNLEELATQGNTPTSIITSVQQLDLQGLNPSTAPNAREITMLN